MTEAQWRALPSGDATRWRGYALEWREGVLVRMVVVSPRGTRTAPPFAGRWRLGGRVAGCWTWILSSDPAAIPDPIP